MSTNNDKTFEELEELEALMAVTDDLASEEAETGDGDESVDAGASSDTEKEDEGEEETIVASGDTVDELVANLTDHIREVEEENNVQVEGEPLEDVERDRDLDLVGAKSDDDSEEKSDDDSDEKEAAILAALVGKQDDEDVVNMKSDEISQLVADGDYLTQDTYNDLDDDAKAEFVEIRVKTDESDDLESYFQRKDIFSDDENEEKTGMSDVDEDVFKTDSFDNEAAASARAQELGCSGTHKQGDMWMPCGTHAEWEEVRRYGEDRHDPSDDQMVKTDEFLCGFQRKSVQQPCDFCQGGCAPEEGLPGLADVEASVKSAYNAEVIGSGYSADDDIFVIDVKREDGSFIEVFVDGEGEELGWLRLDETALEGKSAEQIEIVTKADAEASAVSAYEEVVPNEKGEVMSVTVDVFANQDVYVVEVDGEQKSYDFYVSVQGKVLGYDEWDLIDEPTYELSEEEEIKALEADLEIKRLYSREQRMEMAESGEAMEDGSFPIADESDLRNAILAVSRASDVAAARAHIMRRAEELGLEDMIPTDWQSEDDDSEEVAPSQPVEAEKSAEDAELAAALAEWQSMTGENS